AVKRLDDQGAIRLQVLAGKLKGKLAYMRNPRSICRGHSRQVGGHIGNYKVDRLPVQALVQILQNGVLTKISQQKLEPCNGLHGQEIQRQNAAIDLART